MPKAIISGDIFRRGGVWFRVEHERDDTHGAPEKECDEHDAAKAALAEWDEDSDQGGELKALQELQEEAEGYAPDWHHGATLIRESHFEDYCRELAEDIHGSAIRNASWPFDHIDWTAAAEAAQQDYTSADYDGVTYWVR